MRGRRDFPVPFVPYGGICYLLAWLIPGRARAARPALVNGAVGLVWTPGGQPRVVFDFTIAHAKIVKIDMVADPERLRQMDLTILKDE
ncbi:MAG TPA: hypothetical protein VHM88_21700 [Candidatus Acidoferrales bacterium]|nr:hypothetical protein [Candidatus Acidoferrales bacterium]